MNRVSAAAALFLATAPLSAQTPAGERELRAQVRTANLFIAIRDRDRPGVRRALKEGADPNSRNLIGFTALMWAAMCGENDIVQMLLEHGGKINDTSLYGSPTTFAIVGRAGQTASLLLSRGASADAKRVDGASILMLAAADNQAGLIRRLIAQGANPNGRDQDGATPLIYAARLGHVQAMRLLLAARAKVDLSDAHGRTALAYAAANGHPEAVELLLRKGASVHLRDSGKATPLLLAARYSGDPAVIRALLKAGANPNAKDARNRSAGDLAVERGYSEAAMLLARRVRTEAGPSDAYVKEPRAAVQRSVTLIQRSLNLFAKRAVCSSCHHQGLALSVALEAKKSGFRVDDAVIARYMKQLEDEGRQMGPLVHQALENPQVARLLPAVEIGDFAIGSAYIFGSLIAAGVPPNPGLAEASRALAALQTREGYWIHGFERGQMQRSYLLTTALLLRFLKTYGEPDRMAPTLARAQAWIDAAPPKQTIDLAARLLARTWLGAGEDAIRTASAALLVAQRPDGGWASLPNGRSDAFGTGLALFALHAGGMGVRERAYDRGVRFLLRTQDEDGSWYITKSAMPANNYFDAGFPHGESQYASLAATSWAVRALLPVTQSESASR